jgi:hypothetical protein
MNLFSSREQGPVSGKNHIGQLERARPKWEPVNPIWLDTLILIKLCSATNCTRGYLGGGNVV